jgi:hypothetical protein
VSDAARAGRELYLYWKLAPGHRETALAALREFQRASELSAPGLAARILLRDDDRSDDGPITLMEIYARPGVPGGVDPQLQAQIASAGDAATAAWRIGPRHLEVFVRPDDPGPA